MSTSAYPAARAAEREAWNRYNQMVTDYVHPKLRSRASWSELQVAGAAWLAAYRERERHRLGFG